MRFAVDPLASLILDIVASFANVSSASVFVFGLVVLVSLLSYFQCLNVNPSFLNVVGLFS